MATPRRRRADYALRVPHDRRHHHAVVLAGHDAALWRRRGGAGLPVVGWVPFATIRWANLQRMLLPTIALALPVLASLARVVRASMLEALRPGLRTHRPRQGTARNAGHLPPCAAQCTDPASSPRWDHGGLPVWRVSGYRAGVRAAGAGPADGRRHRRAQLSADPGCHPAGNADIRRGQFRWSICSTSRSTRGARRHEPQSAAVSAVAIGAGCCCCRRSRHCGAVTRALRPECAGYPGAVDGGRLARICSAPTISAAIRWPARSTATARCSRSPPSPSSARCSLAAVIGGLRGMARRLVRSAGDAADGHSVRISDHPARDRHDCGAWARRGQHGHCNRRGLCADLRADAARTGAAAEGFGLCRRGPDCGSTGTRILVRHLLPNLSGIILVQASLSLSTAILVEASLSFLGLGTQPPTPSLGRMLSESRNFVSLIHGLRYFRAWPFCWRR